jgi:hypothetical protein
MLNPKLATLAFLFLAACATAPAAPVEAPPTAQDDYAIQIERRANAMLAADPGAVPAGLEISVLSVEEARGGLFYKVELSRPERRGREGLEYVIYGQCARDDVDRCAAQIVSGAKMLRK